MEFLNSDFQNLKGLKEREEAIKIVQIPTLIVASKVFDRWENIRSPGTFVRVVMTTPRCSENPFDKVNDLSVQLTVSAQ